MERAAPVVPPRERGCVRLLLPEQIDPARIEQPPEAFPLFVGVVDRAIAR